MGFFKKKAKNNTSTDLELRNATKSTLARNISNNTSNITFQNLQSNQTINSITKPDEAQPGEAQPDEAQPDGANPDEAHPDEAQYDDTCFGSQGFEFEPNASWLRSGQEAV